MPGQQQRGLFSDLANSQAEDQSIQGDGPARVDPFNEIADTGFAITGFLAQFAQPGLVTGQTKDVRRFLQPAPLVKCEKLLFT